MCGVGTARRGRAIYTRSNEVKKDHEAGVQSNSDSGSRSYFTFGSIGRFNADPFAVSVANKLVISNFHPFEPRMTMGAIRAPFVNEIMEQGELQLPEPHPPVTMGKFVPKRTPRHR